MGDVTTGIKHGNLWWFTIYYLGAFIIVPLVSFIIFSILSIMELDLKLNVETVGNTTLIIFFLYYVVIYFFDDKVTEFLKRKRKRINVEGFNGFLLFYVFIGVIGEFFGIILIMDSLMTSELTIMNVLLISFEIIVSICFFLAIYFLIKKDKKGIIILKIHLIYYTCLVAIYIPQVICGGLIWLSYLTFSDRVYNTYYKKN